MLKDRSTLILLALGSAFAILALAPILPFAFDAAIGSACGGASDALWRLWSTSTGVSAAGFPSASSPGPTPSPLIALGFHALVPAVGGAIAAWNTMVFLGYVCLTVGTIAFAHRISPSAPLLAHITCVLTVVGSAAWAPLVYEAGIDVLPCMLVPGALALLHTWLEPKASKWVGFGASLLFLFSVLGHWSVGVFVISMTIPMAIVMNRHWEGVQARNRTILALGPGMVVGGWHIYSSAPSVHGLDVAAAVMAPAWVTQMAGALVLPATAAIALPSLGILMLALAGVAARPKDSAGWLLAATWGILLAAGTTPESAQDFLPAPHMMKMFPALATMESWWAVAPLVALPLGVAAMRGVTALHKVQREKLAMGVLLIALVDQTIPAVSHIPSRSIAPALGAETQSILSNLKPGAILQLPSEAAGCTQRAEHRLWQPIHGRAVSTAAPKGRDGGLQTSYLARLLKHSNLETLSANRPKEQPLDADHYLCAQADLHTLNQFGFAAILLDNRTGEYEKHADILRQTLGNAGFDDQGVIVWPIEDALPAVAPTPCPLPLAK